LIPIDGKFTVTATSVKSKLHSVPACQSITKKAIVEKLKDLYGVDHFDETGAEYTVKLTLLKDRATLTVDTSGSGLHKRGYRVRDVAAPIKETLAAAMVQLSFWKQGRILLDPCCGSGTIAIEAAMIGRNIAPGLNRDFVCREWEWIPKTIWQEEKKAAYEQIDYDSDLRICASDIDARALDAAKDNAEEAGVSDCIEFRVSDLAKAWVSEPEVVMITNPPYGERIGEKKEIERIYKSLHSVLGANPDWSLFIITTDKRLEQLVMGRPADRRRKLYNGRLEVCYYQFHGRRKKKDEFKRQ
jgi:putative N6-adenine-specific DNA methylase